MTDVHENPSILPYKIACLCDLRDKDGANVLVLGCAGMAYLRADLEREAGIPVVDPTQAAVSMALGRVLLARGEAPSRQAAE